MTQETEVIQVAEVYPSVSGEACCSVVVTVRAITHVGLPKSAARRAWIVLFDCFV
jgi:hypothetical protein